MANIYRKINTDLIVATENTAYIVPSNSRALVKSIHIYNEGAGPADVSIKIESNTITYVYDTSPTLAAGVKEEFIQNILVLEENDKLKFLSDITGTDVIVSLLELNREDR